MESCLTSKKIPSSKLQTPNSKLQTCLILYLLDIAGTFVFALSGGFRAVRHELDLLGVLVLSVATGVGGGILRDLILGDTPPAVFKDEWYLVVCLLAGLVVFFAGKRIAKGWNKVMLADAIGLGLFAGIGAAKAMSFGLGPIGIVMMAALTATGGGIIRDLLVLEIPSVIKKDFYATAALLGGIAFLISESFTDTSIAFVVAAIVTSSLRLVAMKTKMALPKAK